jgi:hypothetical protein
MISRRYLCALLVAAALAVAAGHQSARAASSARRLVVLELFTSQGCSSCPAADELLGYIAAMREDVIALSFHVDYWNYIGWKDLFATAETTARQKDYADALGISYVYTPQLVIDGRRHVVGSDKRAVVAEIERSLEASTLQVPVEMTSRADGSLAVRIAAADSFDGAASVWLVNFDRQHETQVDAGENSGRSLVNYHVVREHRRIGTWRGEALTFDIDAEDVAQARGTPGEGCAILVQEGDGTGRIVGAQAVWMEDSRS